MFTKFYKIVLGVMVIASLPACQKEYTLDADFSVPTTLNSNAPITLDVTSANTIVFTWEGGGAADGGLVLYTVLFDKEGGDFSNPIETVKSDLGAKPSLTMTHSALNVLARKAGIPPQSTGKLVWTVHASKGGVVKQSELKGEIQVTRGEGIDNIPTELYLYGSGAEIAGQAFRQAEESVFVIYTELKTGEIEFRSGKNNDAFYYSATNGKLSEGKKVMNSTAKANAIQRITVDFNTLQVKTEQVGNSVRCIWGATYNDIAVLTYIGEGKFQGSGSIRFLDPSRPDTNPPSWLGWTEERYYFIAKVNDADVCWGRHDSVSAERPVGGEPMSFYALYEFTWSQWDHLWKMSGSLDNKTATITIDTNNNGLMVHTFSNIK